RRMIAMSGMFAAGLALMLGARAASVDLAVLWLSLGAGATYFALSAHWATTIDIARRHAGTVSGFMNWGGNIGGIISPLVTPVIARKLGWIPAFEIAAVVIAAGGLLWLVIDPERKMVEG